MGCNERGERSKACGSAADDGGPAAPINCFALVTYIPDPLGRFLDDVRRELVPNCMPRAHVTILPPRPLSAPSGAAVEELGSKLTDVAAFEIEAKSVQLFEETQVIYIGLGMGRRELHIMHEHLNQGQLEFDEPFPYHPHITLAQELPGGEVRCIFEKAQSLWAEWPGRRSFPVETITFVQNTNRNTWLDLAHWSLGAVPSVR